MTRVEAAAVVALAVLMIFTGLVWMFGAPGLVGCGVSTILVMTFVHIKPKE
jgi:hypothetical protein